MDLFEAMLAPRLLFACGVYAVAVLALELASEYVHEALGRYRLQWAWDHGFGPLLRAALLVLFIVLAYPALFGLEAAPSIVALLAEDHVRFSNLYALLFLVSLLLPLLPVVGSRDALLLPVQGCLASVMVFSWLARYLGLYEVSYWPGLTAVVLILALALLSYGLAGWLAGRLGEWIDESLNVEGGPIAVMHAIALLFQLPTILIMGLALGRQIGGP